MIELRCSRETAIWLGAIRVNSVIHYRELREAGHMLVRDKVTGEPMFWPFVPPLPPHLPLQGEDA